MSKIIGSRQAQYLYLVLLNFAIALGIFTSTTDRGIAQIAPDSTLPNNSTVNLEENTSVITGGTSRGSNLFHSFQEFSVPTGATAYFNNATDIQNIISRVTGGSISNIDGLIRANGNANLFLINPNGIIFGPNATLNIGGSFFATTAGGVRFADGFEFSANTFSETPLLTIAVPIGLQFGKNPLTIQVQGNGQGLRTTSELIDTTVGLRVQPNQTLAIVGGDISLEGATLKTAGGRIELGSVAQESLVSLTPIDKGFSLGYDSVQNFGNLQLSQQATVDASGEGGGDVQLMGRHITVNGGSRVEASTLGSKPGGAVVVNALESVELIGVSSSDSQIPSVLVSGVYLGATGTGGEVKINTSVLQVTDGARVVVSTSGAEKGRNLTVNASEKVQLFGTRADFSSGLYNISELGATGTGGDLIINTSDLLIQDEAQVGAATLGSGKGGSLTVNATNSVQLIDTRANGLTLPTVLSTTPLLNATGAAGNLVINTGELLVQGGAQIRTGTDSAGNGGDLVVNASKRVQLISTRANGSLSSLFSGVSSNATGAGGNLTINTSELLVQDGSQVSASTFGAGNGGNLTVNASEKVQLIDIPSANGANNQNASNGLFTISTSSATGRAGDLTINTSELLVQGGSQIRSDTQGAGNSGNLVVNASKRVQLDATRADGSASVLFSGVGQNATGAGGNLTINTTELLVQGGAEVGAGTFGAGKGGSLAVNAPGRVELIGITGDEGFSTGLFSSAFLDSTGAAGDITINTGKLVIRDRAVVAVQGLGKGNAGNLEVNARSIRLENFGILSANTNTTNADSNQQATINLRSQDLVLLGNSRIATDARGENVIGGNININTGVLAAFQNSDITANSDDFRGGRVQINAQGVFGTQPRNLRTLQSDITATGASPQLSGTIELNVLETNPTQELVELPQNIIDVSQLMEQNLCAASEENEFIITGRGGLPNSPQQALQADAGWEDWRILHESRSDNEQQTVFLAPPNRNHESKIKNNQQQEIVEAQGWIVDDRGDVVLVVNPVVVTPDSFWSRSQNCQT
ncbi:hypothetical protein NUACC21_60930 [Scytonema sp. NUACC21]